MLFFLILLGIISIMIIILILLLLSTIKIEIKNLRIENAKIKTKYNVKISINILNKIKILSINLNNQKIKKVYSSKRFQKININKFIKKLSINKANLQVIKHIKPKIEKLQLYIDLGIEDAVLTSYSIAILASTIGIILPYLAKNIENCKYIVNPLYIGKNELNIDLDSIISLKIVHIIYVIYFFIMKGREKNERTSDRRSYDYSYGQY